jgi:hypothetical protein
MSYSQPESAELKAIRFEIRVANADTQQAIDLGHEALADLRRIQARLENMENEAIAIRDRMNREANRQS